MLAAPPMAEERQALHRRSWREAAPQDRLVSIRQQAGLNVWLGDGMRGCASPCRQSAIPCRRPIIPAQRPAMTEQDSYKCS